METVLSSMLARLSVVSVSKILKILAPCVYAPLFLQVARLHCLVQSIMILITYACNDIPNKHSLFPNEVGYACAVI